ncbi:MAG: hypothetical protein COA79_18895 [Planctomycetota bacterium]|nr:MAG: hypothetical protein COA79_18895 [Planctomycetota bacterium]
MEEIMNQIPALNDFGIYFGISIVFLALFQKIYGWVTPYDEWKLIKENNSAAAIAFAGAIIGFTLALASASAHSTSLTDFAIWSIIALIAQVFAFSCIRLLMPKIVLRIEENEIAAGITLCGLSIAVGIINASCMLA